MHASSTVKNSVFLVSVSLVRSTLFSPVLLQNEVMRVMNSESEFCLWFSELCITLIFSFATDLALNMKRPACTCIAQIKKSFQKAFLELSLASTDSLYPAWANKVISSVDKISAKLRFPPLLLIVVEGWWWGGGGDGDGVSLKCMRL